MKYITSWFRKSQYFYNITVTSDTCSYLVDGFDGNSLTRIRIAFGLKHHHHNDFVHCWMLDDC